MKKIITPLISSFVFLCGLSAQNYPQIVTFETEDGNSATFTSVGMAEKAKDVPQNAIESLFYTLFNLGVDGINNGKPVVTGSNSSYMQNFFANRISFFVKSTAEQVKPVKNANKMFQGTYIITVAYGPLVKDLERNGLKQAPAEKVDYAEVENMENRVLPTIMVVPYKKDGETYASILNDDYDRRVAVSKVQSGFESRDITTVDLEGKLNALRRTQEFEANNADSNDKQLIANSGADVYVTVDLHKSETEEGARVSLIMKAHETASGSIIASHDAMTRRFRNIGTDMLCSYAVEDNIGTFLDMICKNFTKQASAGKRVTLNISLDGASSVLMSDRVGPKDMPLSTVIHQWVRQNAYMGKFHLQGMVDEGIIFDYVMIPPVDSEGMTMDAAQFGFKFEEYLNDQIGVSCASRIDGNTIHITIY